MLAARVGLWTSGIVTALGAAYCAGLLTLAAGGGMRLDRPSEGVQLGAGVATLVIAQLVLAMIACIHRTVHDSQRVLTQLAVLFTALFAAMVSINRFVQLTVVRQSTLAGETEGLARFQPYSSTSAMFALEILGWGFFLALALLTLAPVFIGGRLESYIRWTGIAYAALSLVGTVGYALDNRLFVVGFLAWGGVFYLWTGLLAVWFRRGTLAASR